MGVSDIPPERTLIVWDPTGTAPAGYIKANGAAISRTVYAWLYGKIGTTFGAGDGATTFNVPDLRGEFLRGLDDGRGVDSGRTLGSAQAGDIQSHNHTTNANRITGSYAFNPGSGAYYGITSAAATNTAAGGTETRPRNVAGLYCIAYAP